MRKLLCFCLVFSVCLCLCSCKFSDYKKAMSFYETGEYKEAIAVFKALGDYKDSVQKIADCELGILENKYTDAVALMDAGQYEAAIDAFKVLDGHKDSVSKIEECETAILEQTYDSAVAAMDSGSVVEAYDALIALNGYKDSAERAAAIYTEYEIAKLKQAEVGDYVIFGAYEQDNDLSNGKEAIEWLVLGKDDTEISVLSKYALECMPYHTSNKKIIWKTCSLRQWLNYDFMDAAFSDEEKSRVKLEWHKLPDSEQGEITQDYVFLPTPYFVRKYADNKTVTQCKPTAYAAANGGIRREDYCVWWLFDDPFYFRPSKNSFARVVDAEGTTGYYFPILEKKGVRPYMNISIEP